MSKKYKGNIDNTIDWGIPAFRRLTAAVISAVLAVAAIIAAGLFPAAYAEDEVVRSEAAAADYYITGYDVSVNVNKNHSYDISEEYRVSIPADLKSLEIKIPLGSYNLADIRVLNTSCRFSTEGNYRIAKVVSPEDLTAGEHTFQITYTIEEYADHNDSMDTLYINLLPPDWDRAIVEFRAAVTVPDDFDAGGISVYSGQYGSKDDGRLTQTVSGSTLTITGSDLPPDYGVTIKSELPAGYWQDVLDNAWTASASCVVLGLGVILMLLLWIIGGKDPKTVPTVERTPIDGVLPSDINYIFSGETKIKDIITLIIYLGIKGYLRIVEYAPKKYKLVRLAEPKDEERFIRNVYHTLFEGVYEGRAVEMEDLGTRLRDALKGASLDIESGYSSKEMQACTALSRVFRYVSLAVLSICVGMIPVLADMYQYKSISYLTAAAVAVLTFITAGLTARTFDREFETEQREYVTKVVAYTALYLVVVFYAANQIANVSGSFVWPVLIIALGGAALFLICIMKARAEGNAVLVARLRSLRRFIDRSESPDFMDLMLSDKNYYYDMLPYAFQFSLMDKWARKFRWLGVEKAAWYADEISGHAITKVMRESTTIEVAREMNTFARTIESDYYAMEHKYKIFN